jgi:hypothetical protein
MCRRAETTQRLDQEFKDKQYFKYMSVENGTALVTKKSLAQAKMKG